MSDDTKARLIALYLEKRGDLRRFFAARLGSPEAAEDLVQDIYLRLVQVEPAGEIDNASAYLYRLGANLMLDRLKQRRRAVVRDDAYHAAHSTTVAGVDLDPQAPADEVVAARLDLARVVAVLREIDPRQATAFRLHKFEGLSHAEVAARMGMSRSSVEKWISAVLRRLGTWP